MPANAPLEAGWCLRSELNQRHADFQSAALPTELQRHIKLFIVLSKSKPSEAGLILQRKKEIADAQFSPERKRSELLLTIWWEQLDSNQ